MEKLEKLLNRFIGPIAEKMSNNDVIQSVAEGFMRTGPVTFGVCIFVILGNYLPKCRQNFTMGYRLPWTLNDEDNWNKTNRLAGYVMVLGGILIIIMSFFDLAFWAVILFVGAILIIPSVYSFLLYRKK